jgi:hypothetical protein
MGMADERAVLSEKAVAALNAAVGSSGGRRAIDTQDVLRALSWLDEQTDAQKIKRFADADRAAVARFSAPARSGYEWMGVPLTRSCAKALRAAIEHARETGSLPVQASLLELYMSRERHLSREALAPIPDTPSVVVRARPARPSPRKPRRRQRPSARRRARTRRLRVIAVIGIAAGLMFGLHLVPTQLRGGEPEARPGGARPEATPVPTTPPVPETTQVHETTPGGARVTATLNDGTIAVTELAAGSASALATTRPLGLPIHVDPADASLAGPATISFPVPEAELSSDLDPAQDVAIATRSADTGYSWELVGGDYDPTTKTISVETTHFSDWMAVAINPARLASEAVGFVSGLLGALKPDSTCPGRRLELDVVVADSANPDLKACASETDAHKLILDVGNPHGFPLALQLPEQVAVDSGISAPDSVWTALVEAQRGDPTLTPGSKRTFTIDRAWFDEKPADRNHAITVTAGVDVPTFVYDMTEFVAFLVLGVQLEKIDKKTSSTDSSRQPQLMDCIYNTSAHMPRTTTGASAGLFLDRVIEVIKKCYRTAVDALAATSAKKLGVVAAKGVAHFLFRGVNLLLNANEFRQKFKEFYSTVKILAAEGSYHPTVTLIPHEKAEPAPPAPKPERCKKPSWWNAPGWIGYGVCRLRH